MRRWPDTLPSPFQEGYAIDLFDQAIRSDMEVGERRARRITRARRDDVALSLRLTDPEFKAFRAWLGDEPWSLAGPSDDLSGWTASEAAVVADARLGPDWLPVDRVVESVATAVHEIRRAFSQVPADDEVVSVAATCRDAGRGWARLRVVGRNAATTAFATLDLATGAVASQSGCLQVEVKDRGAGWWRLALTGSVGAGAAAPTLRVALMAGPTLSVYAGDGASGVDVCEVNARRGPTLDLVLPTQGDGSAWGAAGGTGWFRAPLAFGGGVRFVEARPIGRFRAVMGQGFNWDVSGSLEVRDA